MTGSRSRPKASRAWLILVALLLLTGVANAGRRRVVVLEFEGDKAEQFHEDVVRLIKKSHTVVSLDKWNGTAEEMSASKLSAANVKKVAKKLKVDGVISGTVEKRRDEYILRMKLRAGTSGELVGEQINIKSESAKLDGTAAKDVKDELIEVIATLESNREGGGGGGGGDDEEEKPKKSGFGKKAAAEDEEEKPKKAGKKPAEKPAEDEEKPKKAGKKPSDDEVALKPKKDKDEEKPKKAEEKPKKAAAGEDDEDEKPKKAQKVKKVAAGEDGEDGEGIEGGAEPTPITGDAMYAPSERSLDVAVGLSFTARRMAFTYNATQVTKRPAGYKQSAPVPGGFFDITVYPYALLFGHQVRALARNIGTTVMFDRVISINSKDPNANVKLASSEQRFAAGPVFRYPIGTGAAAPVVGGALRFGQQSFTISGMSEIPNVSYSMVDVTGFFQYPLTPKMIVGINLTALLPLDAGDITLLANYGRAKITGFEGSGTFDYMILKNVFARAEVRGETLGYAFKGEGARSKGVGGARDTYYGGTLTAGFLY